MQVENSIIARCKKHNKAAFVELFKMYERYLYKLCYSYVQNEQDALDLIQEIYIKVFKNISMFDIKMPFHPWIRTIAVNTCLNFKRSCRYDSVSLNLEDINGKTLKDELPAKHNTEESVLNNELGQIIKESLKYLKPKYRMVLILRYYEELSYEEIAAELEEPLGTVKTDIYRAKNLLKERLKNVLSC